MKKEPKTAADLTTAIQASFDGKPAAHLKAVVGKTKLASSEIAVTEIIGNLAVVQIGKVGSFIAPVSAILATIENTKFLKIPLPRWIKTFYQNPKNWKEATFLLKIQIAAADSAAELDALRDALVKKKIFPEELAESFDRTAAKLKYRK